MVVGIYGRNLITECPDVISVRTNFFHKRMIILCLRNRIFVLKLDGDIGPTADETGKEG